MRKLIVIHYKDTNSLEATWSDVETVEYQETVQNEDGTETTETKTREVETFIRCHSYADVQMQMFKDDIVEYGGDVAEYSELIATVEANIKPPTAEELAREEAYRKQTILMQIAELEASQARPIRELNSSKSAAEQKAYAQAKIDSIDEQIDALRSQL